LAKSVKKGDVIKVEYVGSFPDGKVFDKSEGRGPLEFEAGAGQMIKGFDKAVIGMKLNEEKTVVLEPEDAYGKEGEGQRLSIPEQQLGAGVKEGMPVASASGEIGKVVEVKNGIVTLEFSHPMAGKKLQFWIKVVAIN
jgi:FKBP-type peptidyl-prolyl cis-trans isomerase 2